MDKQKTTNQGSARVWLEKPNIITCELRGVIDAEVGAYALSEIQKLVDQLEREHKRANFLVDISGAIVQSSRTMPSTKRLSKMRIARIAIVGKTLAPRLTAQYLIHIAVIKNARVFSSCKDANKWLSTPEHITQRAKQSHANIYAAALLGIIAAVSFCEWFLFSGPPTSSLPRLIIINPVTATNFIILAATLAYFSVNINKLTPIKKAIIGSVGLWLFIYGAAIWTRAVFGLDLDIDRWLFSDKINFLTLTAPRTALNFGLVAILIWLVLTGQKSKWHRITFAVAISIILINSIAAIIGYSFGIDMAAWFGVTPMSIVSAICFLIAAYILQSLSKPLPALTKLFAFFDRYRLPIAACAILIVITGVSWQQSKTDQKNAIRSNTLEAFSEELNLLEDGVSKYASLLYGYRSFFEAANNIGPDDFEHYYATSNTAEDYPGLSAVAYINIVPSQDKQAYIQEMRQLATALNPEYANFTIKPANTNQDTSYILQYIKPDSESAKIGYDLSDSPERVEALETTRDTDELTITEPINISSAIVGSTEQKIGSFITLPVYSGGTDNSQPQTVEERREQIIGFINIAFVYDDFFNDILEGQTSDNLNFVITDVDSNSIIYQSNSEAKVKSEPAEQANVYVGNRTWQLSMYTSSTFGATRLVLILPIVVPIIGFGFAILIPMLIASQIRKKQKALELATEMTSALNDERNEAIAANLKSDAILSSIGDAVFAIDKHGKIIMFNKATEKISGYAADDVIGKPYVDILKFTRDNKDESKFIQNALNGRPSQVNDKITFTKHDGKQITVSNSTAPLIDHTGKIIGAIIIFRDVTRETQLEKAKDEFVTLASHQLRTPLSAINWYSELLLSGDSGHLGKQQKDTVEKIHTDNQRMINIVNSLLDVSRIDLNKLINKPSPVEVHNLILEVEKEMAPTIESKEIKINNKIDKNIPNVLADPRLLKTIVQNLLNNAVIYNRTGGELTISVRRADAAKDHIIISVSDTGIGIPKAQQSRVLERFFRADNARTKNANGSGLGLYLVQQIIEQLGGKFWFESAENIGSTFYILLPIKTKINK